MFAGGDQDKNAGGSGYKNARQNYFGRVNYNYSEKLLVEFVWRYDGSYIFPANRRFGFFPGVSVGWRLSEEKFWKNNFSVIENLKLRGSWGKTGNDRIDPWQYLSTYSMNSSGYTYIFGVDQQNRLLSESRIPNENVTWEVAKQADIGIEGDLFNSKLFFVFDVFDNRRSNILWRRNASVPGSTGLTLPRENIGKTRNRGFDLSLGYQNRLNKFKYSVSLNGGYAKNQIVFWDEAPGAPEWQRSTGKPIPSDPNNVANDLYYEAIGIFKDQKAIDAYPHWSSARPGDIIFRDVNDDKKIDGNDRVRNSKNNVPRFTGGLNLRLTYNQFDLSVLLQGAAGAVQYIKTESGEIGNYLKDYYDNRWTVANTDASGPRTNISTAEYWDNRNTYFLHSSDYMRLKNLELSYSLPPNLNKLLGITRARIYVSGYNLFTYSPHLKDFDPEMTDTQGQSYPVQRVLNFGANVTF
jgi:TonB-linked SusC/RagA family outer membrane protein